METKLEQTLKAHQPAQQKVFKQAGMKDPMPAPLVIHGSTNNSVMAKTADTGMMPGMGGNSTTQPTFWYSPEMDPSSWVLPKSRIETLRFCKIYYNLDPYIHSILNMHAQYGFSKFKLQCKDPKYTKLYNTLFSWNPEFDWYQFALDVALSYYKYGEACVWGSWNAARRTWDRLVLIDPALIEYKEDLFTGHATMELIPTVEMKQAVKEAIMQGRQDIDPMLLDAVQNNKKLPLDTEGTEENVFTGQKYSPAKVFMFARRTDPSSTRGTSALQCGRGSTKVKLLDGTTPTMEELYTSGKRDFWVYSIDPETGIVFKKADYVIKKGKALTYDITLDNGQVLGFTAEHPFMLRDGSYRTVKDLKPGDSLMPLYVKDGKIGNGFYEKVYNPVTGLWEFTHRLVDLPNKFRGCVIHHKNFNSHDNRPENLQVTTFTEHVALHKYLLEKYKDRRLEGLARYRETDKFKENCKITAEVARKVHKELWKQQAYREKMAMHNDKRIAALKKVLQTKKYKENRKLGHDRAITDLYKADPLFTQIEQLKNGYIQTTGGKLASRHYKGLISWFGLNLRVLSKNGVVFIYTPDYDIKKHLTIRTVGTPSVLNTSIVEKCKELLSTGADFVLLDNESCGINSSANSSAVEKTVRGYFPELKCASMRCVASTIIYKVHAAPIVEKMKANLLEENYRSIGKARADEYIDCEALVLPLLYSEEDTFTYIPFTRSTCRQLRNYVKHHNLPIRIHRENGKVRVERVLNHKVVSVVPAKIEDVYDIHSVEDTHNFMVCTDDGSGVCVHNCLFKDMYLKDVLRMSQIAVAQKTQLPIELWTVGHLGSDEQSSILPGPEMLEEVRTMITNATQQPPYSIVYGPYLKYEALGVTGKLLDIYNDLGYVENQILVGLGVNKAVVLGEGPNVQGKAISLNRLIREYAVLRDLFESFMQKYVLLPIAKANNLVDEEGQYILPKLNWEVSLSPEQDKERFDMCYKMWKDGLISTMSLFEKCPEKFDYILEMKRLEDEKGSVFDKGNSSRLGGKPAAGTTGGTPVAPGGSTSGGNVRDGKGNPDLRDFALGGNNASAINDSSATGETSVGDGANAASTQGV